MTVKELAMRGKDFSARYSNISEEVEETLYEFLKHKDDLPICYTFIYPDGSSGLVDSYKIGLIDDDIVVYTNEYTEPIMLKEFLLVDKINLLEEIVEAMKDKWI